MKQVLLLLLLLIGFSTKAQLYDSTSVGIVKGLLNTYYDTVLNIEQFHRFNEYQADQFGMLSMGNQGDVRRRLSNHFNFQIDPNLGVDGYFKNFKENSTIPFYNVLAPSGGLRLQTGYERGQLFGLYFTINPSSRFNVFLDFQRTNSRGNYFNQENRTDILQFSSSFETKEGFYRFFTSASWNKAVNLEYGGIQDIAAFEENTTGNRELVAINLMASGSRIRATNVLFNHDFRLFTIKNFKTRLRHQIDIKNEYFVFQSSDSAFASNAIIDDGSIRDSIGLSRIQNTVGLTFEERNQVLFAGFKHSGYQYGNDNLLIQSNILGFTANYDLKLEKLRVNAEADLYFTEAFAGSYAALGKLSYTISNNTDITAYFESKRVVPGFFYQQYISNNFIWNNQFSNVGHNKIELAVNHARFNLKGGLDIYDNYLFLNELAIPEQAVGGSTVFYGELQSTILLGASFYLDNKVRFQQVSNNQYIRIPNWILRHVLYFERDIFKGNSRIQTGVEFQYFSSFRSEAYMPATSMMYLQNEIQIGNYPYFNFLFNFKIRDFTFFVRLENITQGLFEYNYYAAPLYPLPDFSFRIGASWRFFN